MERKKYTIQEKEYTLAAVTPKRLSQYCELIGIKDFSELNDAKAMADVNSRLLNVGLDTVKINKLLHTCLIEIPGVIDLEEIDLSIVDEIFNDFFSQRLRRL